MRKRKAALALLSKWADEDEAYLAGLKEGARRERRALRRIANDCMRHHMQIPTEIYQRLWPTKRAKRLDGKGK